MKKSIIALFVLFLSQAIHAGVNIYVSPTGNDSNAGTQDQPLASFRGALSRIQDMRANETINDTIFVRVQSGKYLISEAITLTAKDAGTEQSPVVFVGNENQHPMLCGGQETDRFEEVAPNLWRVFIPEVKKYGLYFEQLYINDERRFRAQTPNMGDDGIHPEKVLETRVSSNKDNNTSLASQRIVVKPEQLSILKDLEKEGYDDALLLTHHKWSITRKAIKYVNVNDSSMYVVGKEMPGYSQLNNEARYIVENYRAALDQPGEWFLDRSGYLYYIPKAGETIENTTCVYPLSEKMLIFEGQEGKEVAHIHFKNIDFKYTSYKTPAKGVEPFQAAVDVDAAIMANHAHHITFDNCDIAHTGQYAFWFKQNCSYNKVNHCHMYDLGAGGVKIGDYDPSCRPVDENGLANTHHIVINNNIIQHGGYISADAVGLIIFFASDNEVTHNDIADFRYSGISVGWVWGYTPSPTKRNKIEYNHVQYLGWGELSDMGGIYTLGLSEGTSVSNNVVHHIHSYTYGGWGLYTDEGSTGIRLENNLVYKCKNAGFHQHYGKDNVIKNNIFALNLYSQAQLTKMEDHLSFSFTNNIFYLKEGLIYMDMWKDSWILAKTRIDKNCFWNPLTTDLKFHDVSFDEWKKLGKDKHSIIADPLFEDPEHYDFRFKSKRVARKIGFKPFDYTEAGVYGNQEWKNKALLSQELKDKFEVVIKTVK